MPESVGTRKAGISIGIGKGAVFECGWYGVHPGWKDVVQGNEDGNKEKERKDGDAWMKEYFGE